MRPADSPVPRPAQARYGKQKPPATAADGHRGVRRRDRAAACCVRPGGTSSVNGVPAVNWYIGAQAGGWIEDAIATCNTQNTGKFVIKEQELPSRATDQREQIVRRLAANDSSIDLIGMDVIWTGGVRERRMALRVPGRCQGEAERRRAQGPARERAPIRASSTALRTRRTPSCSGTARTRSLLRARTSPGTRWSTRPWPST